MNVNSLSIKTKLVCFVLLISSIFIASSFYIKSANSKVSSNFNQFYSHTYSATLSFENLKNAQTNIMLNIRGLQISYLLGLTNQVKGYIDEIGHSEQQTPKLVEELNVVFKGDSAKLQTLEAQIYTFHEKSRAFITAMQVNESNKAPFPVFAAFRDAYVELQKQFSEMTELNKQAADASHLDATNTINNATWLFYISTLTALIAAIIAAVIFANKLIRNINKVKATAIDLSKGNLNTQCDIDSNDEIGLLSDALNTTIQNLNSTLSAISQSTSVVANNSQVLLKANGDIQNVANEVSDNTLQAVSAIEELTVTSQDIAQNITDTAHTSESMTSLAEQGIQSSSLTKEEVIKLTKNLDETSNVVGQLREESSRIESILDVIRGISDQTNLLALNAAIEAARAGDHGRGFAVVADEVRGLAQRSQSSVNEIETMLAQLREACDHAVNMMATSTGVAASTEEHVLSNNKLIEEILLMIQKVNEQTQQIATAAEEQSSVAAEVSANMHTMQTLSKETAQISSDTVKSSDEMYHISQQTQEQVHFFTLR